MKQIKTLIEHMNDTLDEIDSYYDDYVKYSTSEPRLASAYIDIGMVHFDIYNKLHKQVVDLISRYKEEKGEIPETMKAIYDYEHQKLVDEYDELKYKYDHLS